MTTPAHDRARSTRSRLEGGGEPVAPAGAALPARLQAFVFDFDGTLAAAAYDFAAMREGVWALARACGVGPQALDDLQVLEAVERTAEMLGEGTPAAAAFRRQAHGLILDLELRAARGGRLLPGVGQALADLRGAGFGLAIVTRNSRRVTDLIPGARDLTCDAFLARESVRRVKPHPEHLQTALAALGCRAAHAAMVGDHPLDIAAGRAVGAFTIGVLTGAGSPETLAAADVILPSVADIPPRCCAALPRE